MNEKWRQVSEMEFIEGLLAQGFNEPQIHAAMKYRRGVLKKEADQAAELERLQKEAEEALEKEKLDASSIYGEYESEEMKANLLKGNKVIEDAIAADLAPIYTKAANYEANKDIHGEETSGWLLGYSDDNFVVGTLNRTYGDKGFKFEKTDANDRLKVTFKGEVYNFSTNHRSKDS